MACLLVVACGDDDVIGDGDDEGDAGPDDGPDGGRGVSGSGGIFNLDAGFRDAGRDAGSDDDDAGDPGDEDAGDVEDAGDAATVSCTGDADCNDSNACTEDSCSNRVCANIPIEPDDSDACTSDSCDPDTGVHNDVIPLNDNNACTADSCDPSTGVAHVSCAGGLCDSTQTCLALTTTPFTDNPALAIPDGPAVVSDTIVVSGVGTRLWDLNVRTSITHALSADMDITLQSPAGTVVTLTTDNGPRDVQFNGTVWDDSANPSGAVPYDFNPGLVRAHPYAAGSVPTPLVPEEALGAFIGENPNGTWTLTISDDAAGDAGSLATWGLDITTIASAPTTTPETFTVSTAAALVDDATTTSTVVVPANASATRVCNVTVSTNISHTYAADLAITLTSPGGRIVTLTTYNGAGNDNVFAGTLWNDDANPAGQVPYDTNNGLATDHAYANLTLASPLAPEEALSAFIGDVAAGTWTLTVADYGAGDIGTLHSWTLNLVRCLR